jgi:hypothetical protein
MIASCFEPASAPKDLKKSKKGLITFITSNHIFLCKSKISISKGLKTSNKLNSYNNSTSMFTIKVIIIVKAFNNNQ